MIIVLISLFLTKHFVAAKNDDQFYSSILSSHNMNHKHDYVRRNSYGDITSEC